MTYIFMDESWDLTFHNIHGSCFFLITFLITSNEKDMKLVMKNLHSRMKWKKVKMKWSFFHATKEDPASIKRVLDLITRREIKIISMILDKSQYQDSEEWVHNLYNKIVGELLKECEKKHFFQDSRIQFIASRRETNKNLNQNFITTLQNYHSEDLRHAAQHQWR